MCWVLTALQLHNTVTFCLQLRVRSVVLQETARVDRSELGGLLTNMLRNSILFEMQVDLSDLCIMESTFLTVAYWQCAVKS